MKKALSQLLEFHLAFQRHIELVPITSVPVEVKEERKMLITEETKELIEAINNGNIQEISKEMCDVLYAVLGTAVAFGLQDKLMNIFDAVHESNMSKLDRDGKPLIREDGKILKSDLYKKPELESLFK